MQSRSGQRELQLSLRAGGASFSLSAHDVDEVLREPRLTRVPNAPAVLDGVASVRGAVLPVFSLARLLDLPQAADQSKPLVVVLRQAGIGVTVDEVTPVRDNGATGEILRPLDVEKLAQGLMRTGSRSSRATGRNAPAEASATPHIEEIALLGFELAGQDYALPLAHVEEAIVAPERATSLPQAAAGDLGVVLWRDKLLPLVSMRALLGLAFDAASHVSHHAIVARVGGSRVAFVVDRFTSVRRARESAMTPVPSILNRGGGEARIKSMHRSGDGRLVSVLSPEQLFADPALAHKLADSDEEDAMTSEFTESAREQIVVFRLGEEEFGLPITAVDEIARLPDSPTRVPRAPAFVKGVMNLRGRVLPLIDQASRFGLERDVASDSGAGRRRVIVTHIDDLLAGFIVDEVREILSLSNSQLRAAPPIASTDPQTFDRVAMLDVEGRMILLVDPRELLNRAEREMLAHSSWTDQSQDAT